MNNTTVIFLDGALEMCGMREDVTAYRKRLRLYSAGTLEVSVGGPFLPGEAVYIYFPEGEQLGIIERAEHITDCRGKRTDIKAVCTEGLLMLRYITDRELLYGSASSVCGELVRKYCMTGERGIDRLDIGTSDEAAESVMLEFAAEGERLDERLYSALRPFGLSYRIRCDYMAGRMYFEVTRGKDRTLSQNVNERLVFSESAGNIISLKYGGMRLPYSVCCVRDADGLTVYGGNGAEGFPGRENIPGREYMMNVFSRQGSGAYGVYRSALEAAGREKIGKLNTPGYTDIVTEASSVGPASVGDLCELECSVPEICGKRRIIRIDETFSEGRHETSVGLEAAD